MKYEWKNKTTSVQVGAIWHSKLGNIIWHWIINRQRISYSFFSPATPNLLYQNTTSVKIAELHLVPSKTCIIYVRTRNEGGRKQDCKIMSWSQKEYNILEEPRNKRLWNLKTFSQYEMTNNHWRHRTSLSLS